MVWMSARRAYRRWKSSPPIVVVSGLPRSGTSMTMKMLQAGGLPLTVDDRRQADEDNPKGYFELERVKKLQEEPDKSWLGRSRGQAVKVISQLLQELPPAHFYQVIFMDRHLDEVLASQNKMLEHRGEPLAEDDTQVRELFERHLRIVRTWLENQPNFEVLYLNYPEVVSDPKKAAETIRAFLRLELDTESMSRAVDRKLYRNRRQPKSSTTLGAS